jgi:NADH:ubiquinone oxidoreductase subunit E
MPVDAEPVEIVICLGSSCFARGNSENLAIITEFVEKHALNAVVRLSGKLCQDECKLGPNLIIGGEAHHEVTVANLRQILQQFAAPSVDG